MVDGKEEENATIYFFDTENFVPIAQESVEGSNEISSKITDYKEFGGLYFATKIITGGGTIIIESIELNPSVEDSEFTMPVN